MPRPFNLKIRDPEWWLEQCGHALIGVVTYVTVASCLIDLGLAWKIQVFAGTGAAAMVAAFREITQNVGDPDNDVLDSIADALAIWIGAWLSAIPTIVGGLVR